ncbi:MAG TPA: UPF0182 family protein, partial [Actinomycetes bacterium]|nr:UPF0182 family protein [Actinomycetes bacterium]
MTFDQPPSQPPTADGPPGRRMRPPGRRRALIPTLVILGVLVLTFALFVGYYTDWLWFRSVGFDGVFTKQLWVRGLMFVLFFSVAAGVVGLNGYLAYRFRPIFRAISLEQQSLDRYRLALEPFRRIVLIAFSALVGFFFGAAALAEWRTVLAWWYRTPFGTVDPQFHKDISFYVFSLPWWRFLLDSAMVLVVVSAVVAAAVHYLYGGIRPQTQGERTTPSARVQLSLLIGIFVLLKAASYWLNRYELLQHSNDLFTGAGYTDINAVLPAKNILTVVALISATLFFINIFRGTWRLAVLSFGLMVLSALAIGGIYPAVVQQIQVKPSQNDKESPYIQRNIDSTKQAYGLDNVITDEYPAQLNPKPSAVVKDRSTIKNVRLMDPSRISPTFDQLQQIRAYYSFPDPLDVDRYNIDGKQENVVVAPREINLDGVPEGQRNWINDHLTYTHGFGVVAAYGNQVTPDGEPVWAEQNIPPKGVLDIKEPRIYFGEDSPEYSIVGAPADATPRELDYPDSTGENGQQTYTYEGNGGVPIGSFFNRIAYAWKFQETNILLSDSINAESQILYNRDPRDRVEEVAPWLTTDADPYPSVVDGQVVWIVDAYTTLDNYPYSQRESFGDVTTDSLTLQAGTTPDQRQAQINYIRNSVKATVNAYTGAVTLYAWDETDPVLQTWEKVFPGTVQPKTEISPDLLAHLRYPEDGFKVQREIYARYHVEDPGVWYGAQDNWQVPTDPTAETLTAVPQPPYYLTLRMPGTDTSEFSLTSTYAPVKRETLASFVAVNSDATSAGYGQMRVLQLPRDSAVPGPSLMQNNFEADTNVAENLSLLRRGGSTVELGNLLTLPVAGGLMYVEPVYVRASSGSSYPLLQKVLVSFGSQIAFEDTYEQALAVFFGEATGNHGNNGNGSNGQNGSNDAQQRLTQALDDASAAYEDGQAALAEGDFAAYGEAQAALSEALGRAERAAAELGLQVPTEPAPTETPSPSPSPSSSTSDGTTP